MFHWIDRPRFCIHSFISEQPGLHPSLLKIVLLSKPFLVSQSFSLSVSSYGPFHVPHTCLLLFSLGCFCLIFPASFYSLTWCLSFLNPWSAWTSLPYFGLLLSPQTLAWNLMCIWGLTCTTSSRQMITAYRSSRPCCQPQRAFLGSRCTPSTLRRCLGEGCPQQDRRMGWAIFSFCGVYTPTIWPFFFLVVWDIFGCTGR